MDSITCEARPHVLEIAISTIKPASVPTEVEKSSFLPLLKPMPDFKISCNESKT